MQHAIRTTDSDDLIGVIQQLSLARSLPAIQDIVRRAARRLLDADGATFVLADGDQCYYAAEDAIEPLWTGTRFPASQCISGWVMRNATAVAIEDIYADERIPLDVYRPTFVRSLVMVPIRASSPIGAIGVYWATEYRATLDEIRLLQALADSTSIAMENVTVYTELEDRVRARTEQLDEANARLRRLNAELQQASAAKSDFLASMSHELRTPLNSILGYSGIMLRGMAGELNAEQSKQLTMIRNAGSHLLGLINDILDLARVESGRVHPASAEVDVASVAASVAGSLAPLAQAKGLEVTCEAPEGGAVIVSDATRIEQILLNLGGNAVKFTSTGGVAISVEPAEAGVVCTVRDTGCGIPVEDLDRIFDEFYRGKQHAGIDGAGLGLAVSARLARLLGGRVDVESALGQGSTFRLWLPADPGPPDS